jgi:hypothetical protein
MVEGKTIDSEFAAFSAPVPLEWNSAPEMPIADADVDPTKGGAVRGKIVLFLRRKGDSIIARVKLLAEAGAKAVIVVVDDNADLFAMPGTDDGNKSAIPVLMVRNSCAVKLRESGRAQIKSGTTSLNK